MSGEGFSNPVVGGVVLVRPAIRSPNYVAGTSGWSINITGDAEFNNAIIRGDLQVGGVPPAPSIEVADPAHIPTVLQNFYTARGEPLVAAIIFWLDATHYNYLATSTSGVTALTVMGSVDGATVDEDIRFRSGTLSLASIATAGTPDIVVGSGAGGQTITFSTMLLDVASGSTVQVASGGAMSLQTGSTWDIDGIAAPRGFRGVSIDTVDSAAVTAETVVMTISNFVFAAGRAYRVAFGSQVETSNVNGRARFRLRKTNAAGTLWHDYGTVLTTGTAGDNTQAHNEGYLRRTAGTDLTATTVLTLENLSGGANTATMIRSTGTTRHFIIEDCGAATDFPNAVAVT